MKYLFGLFLFLIGCVHDPAPVVLPTKSIDTDKTRYFFIGYTIDYSQRGNVYWQCVDGSLPQKEEIIRFCHKSKKAHPFKDEDFIIISLYEFKNKGDRDFFMAH